MTVLQLARILMPVLLHRTESKRDPCAVWFSSGRPNIPQIHCEIHTEGFEEIERFIYALLGGFLGVGCPTARGWLDNPFDTEER